MSARPEYKRWLSQVDFLLRKHIHMNVNQLVADGYDFRADYDRLYTPSLSSAYAALWSNSHQTTTNGK